jgi:hypothetical protein
MEGFELLARFVGRWRTQPAHDNKKACKPDLCESLESRYPSQADRGFESLSLPLNQAGLGSGPASRWRFAISKIFPTQSVGVHWRRARSALGLTVGVSGANGVSGSA